MRYEFLKKNFHFLNLGYMLLTHEAFKSLNVNLFTYSTCSNVNKPEKSFLVKNSILKLEEFIKVRILENNSFTLKLQCEHKKKNYEKH